MKFSSIFSSISPNPIVKHVNFTIFPNYPIRMSLICLVGIIVSFTVRKEKKGFIWSDYSVCRIFLGQKTTGKIRLEL